MEPSYEFVEPVIVYPGPPGFIDPEFVVGHEDAVAVLVFTGDSVCWLQSADQVLHKPEENTLIQTFM